MQVARHTRPEGHFKVWATIIFFRRPLLMPPTHWAEGYPFYSPYRCRLGYGSNDNPNRICKKGTELSFLPPFCYFVLNDKFSK